jgi:mannose-1-phosphate guanylyltransferase/phosphomannomutase
MIEYFVVAGGKGTRSLNPSLPKILQAVGNGILLIDLLLERLNNGESPRKVTFLLGFEGQMIQSYIEDNLRKYPKLIVSYLYDEVNSPGTAGALLIGVEQSNARFSICILGDIATNIDFDLLEQFWELDNHKTFLVAHPTLHPEDSDCVTLVDGILDNLYLKKSSKPINAGSPLLGIAGIYGFDNHSLSMLKGFTGDISGDLIPLILESQKVTVINSSYYIHDVGTPERLESFKDDFRNGSFERRGLKLRNAIFLDRDGVLFENLPKGRTSLDSIEEDIVDAIRLSNQSGIPIFIVTNQPQVSKGFIDHKDVIKVEADISRILAKGGAYIDEFKYCPHHPAAGFVGEVVSLKIVCDCRKPKLGMFLDISKKHSIDVPSSIFIGDTEIDQETAYLGKMKFMLASYNQVVGISTAQAIINAVHEIKS